MLQIEKFALGAPESTGEFLDHHTRLIESDPRFEVLMSEVGGPKRGLMNIGEEAKPPFAVLPDPQTMFLARSKRLEALASEHRLAPCDNCRSYVKILYQVNDPVLEPPAEEGWKRRGQNPFLMGH